MTKARKKLHHDVDAIITGSWTRDGHIFRERRALELNGDQKLWKLSSHLILVREKMEELLT